MYTRRRGFETDDDVTTAKNSVSHQCTCLLEDLRLFKQIAWTEWTVRRIGGATVWYWGKTYFLFLLSGYLGTTFWPRFGGGLSPKLMIRAAYGERYMFVERVWKMWSFFDFRFLVVNLLHCYLPPENYCTRQFCLLKLTSCESRFSAFITWHSAMNRTAHVPIILTYYHYCWCSSLFDDDDEDGVQGTSPSMLQGQHSRFDANNRNFGITAIVVYTRMNGHSTECKAQVYHKALHTSYFSQFVANNLCVFGFDSLKILWSKSISFHGNYIQADNFWCADTSVARLKQSFLPRPSLIKNHSWRWNIGHILLQRSSHLAASLAHLVLNCDQLYPNGTFLRRKWKN